MPASLDPYAPPHPDSLGFAEARLLFNRALHNQTASFSLLMDYAYGLSYLDSLERRRIPLVERCCLRGLYICKAQMLMSLRRHAEALDYLTRAEALTEANDRLPENLREPVEYDSFWSAAAGMTYMGVDTVSTRAERSFLRVVDIARRTGYRGGLYAHAIARLADIYLHQSRYEESIALCRQALDAAPNDPADQSRLIAAENLAEAYRQLGLYDEALHYCSLITDAPTAVEAINNLRGRAYRNRAGILAEMNRTDEALTDRNLDLVRQLADIQSTHENTCDLDTIMESLQRSLFSKEDAERFRRNFSAVYPLALNRLRSRCPDLTFTDELFCMLAMLQLDNSEMARTLGISKPSVSKARYRLRMKLELPEGVDVDAEVRKVMEG